MKFPRVVRDVISWYRQYFWLMLSVVFIAPLITHLMDTEAPIWSLDGIGMAVVTGLITLFMMPVLVVIAVYICTASDMWELKKQQRRKSKHQTGTSCPSQTDD